MAVAVEVDKKVSSYHDKMRYAVHLRKKIDDLKQAIVELESLKKDFINQAGDIKKELIGIIKIEDLLEQITFLTGIDKENLEINLDVVDGIYEDKKEDITCYRTNNSTFMSRLFIKIKNGPVICNQYLSLFNSIEAIQADGKTLLDHCTLVPIINARKTLVVTKNIEDIICYFKLESVDYDNYEDSEYGHVLPDAIKSCINDEYKKPVYDKRAQESKKLVLKK